MNRSHVIRLNPTPEQEVYFRKACGIARHAYNWALARLSFYLANDKFSIDGHTLHVPKLGDVNMTEELRFGGKIMSATISYRAGWWFVSIAVEVKHETPTHSGGAVGIDLGIKTLATLSCGKVFENQKHYRRGEARIKGLSKGLSRKVEGSRNWWKNAKKLAKAHYRVACQRQDTLHKMTTHVARTYALVGLEDLNTKGMLANHSLAQVVSDASFFEVKRQLLYKAEEYGGYVQLVDRWFPSSKTCHVCGWVKEDLTLADRVWVCEQCGTVHDRDWNAAIMVETEALRLIRDVPVVASSGHKFACGAERSGLFEGETVCCEAGTTVL